uniref:Uncharacterized protein n=1 Tax=Anguilla anguilla TaxID=7936 RepID=A0A0E9W8Y5_ANGAN
MCLSEHITFTQAMTRVSILASLCLNRGSCAVCVGSEVYCVTVSSVKCGLCHFFPGETQDCTGSTAGEAIHF